VTDEPLGWGILGTARINRMLIPPLRVSAGNRLVAVASRDRERAEAYAREWQIGRAHGSYEALLADPEIDAVYIPLPNHLHAEWTVKAARAGKHVLCEKPLALSVADVDAMAAACRESGVVLAEAFMYRHHPQTVKVKQLLDAGTIGALRYLRGSFTFPLTRPNDVRLRPEWGGGCLWDIGCYPLSFARLLVGKEPLEVFGSRVLGPTGIDESFAGQLVFPGDVLFQLDAGFRSPVRAEMELVGTEGVIRVHHPWRPEPDHPVLLTREGRTEAIPIPGVDRFLLEIEDLADAARGRKPPRMSLADSRANVAALVALQRSAREGRPVRVETEAA
jgi:predicted dehydrogenase